MSKLFYFALLLLGIPAIGQNIAIPDANFKAALLNYVPAIDTNTDGEIQLSEAVLVIHLNISHKDIASLSGLENFTNLVTLDCSFNQLSAFIGTGLVHLQYFYCQNNTIASLDIDTLPALTFLNFDNNQVSAIDLHNNPVLNSVYCNNNLLSEINLCGTMASWLYCAYNPNLTYISVKNNIDSIVLGGRSATAEPPVGQFDFSECPLLETVCYDEGELQAVEWTLPFSDVNLVTDCSLDCESLRTAAFVSDHYTLAPNPVLDILHIETAETGPQSIAIYNMLGQLIQAVFKAAPISIDVAAFKTGTYFVEINSDKSQTTRKFVKL